MFPTVRETNLPGHSTCSYTDHRLPPLNLDQLLTTVANTDH
ncbi:hypothetical protein RHOER0001_0835 [Rhodococcus erythropolis SK121]|nr:hypothetical protein RHOER0001_0835 [Rhodococcus erythropolis SK121]